MTETRPIGWRQVLIVAAVAVALVLIVDVVTTLVPALHDVVTGTPLVMLVMIGGTAWLLWRIAMPRPPSG